MSRSLYALMALAALAGAAGVIEAAVAAHRIADPHLSTAAHFLLLDATASIAIAAFARTSTAGNTGFVTAASILLCGGVLFCSDLSVRAFLGHRLFPFAAPIGGTLMIAGWLIAAATAFFCLLKSQRS